jgi:hypothetical protein
MAYSFLFFLAIVISWIMRDFARPLIEKIPCKQQQHRPLRRCRARA